MGEVNLSGSRIKARRRVGADGSTEFLGWFDSELMVGCSWETASDDKERCVPSDPLLVDVIESNGDPLGDMTGGQVSYADAACTKVIAFSLPAAAAFAVRRHRYYTCFDPSYAECVHTRALVFSGFQPAAAPFELYSRRLDGGGACEATGVMLDPASGVRISGPLVPPDNLVAASLSTD